jgi:uncharacterized repeat protein (TIGR02543 family)
MRQQLSFVGFDFDSVWKMPAYGGYPILQAIPPYEDVTIDPVSVTFTSATAGYGAQTARQITITNIGTGQLTGLNASLGADSEFEISSALSQATIAPEGLVTIGVRPKTGLGKGSYTDTLTINGSDALNLTIPLSFTVNASAVQYTVAFNANGGTSSLPSVSRDYNTAIGTLPTAEKANHSFTGWYTAASGGTKITTATKVTGNITYYAQYSVLTGWKNYPGVGWKYHLSTGTPGTPATGWQLIGGKWYNFSPAGVMRTGTLKVESKTSGVYDVYHFGTADDGVMKAGWVKHTDGWRYHHATSGNAVRGWLNIGGKWYYLAASDGKMAIGLQTIGNVKYFFDSGGVMKTGWVKHTLTSEGAGWRYYTSSGAMKTGWLQEGKAWYYLDTATGIMKTGWLQIGQTWYYLNPSTGVMATGNNVDTVPETKNSNFASGGQWLGYV